MLDLLLERTGYEAFVRDGSEEGEERWENVRELRSKAAEYDELEPGRVAQRFLEDVRLVQDVDTLDAGGDAVTLITLHAAKGLEFPYVFLTGLEEGLCPHTRSLDDRGQLEEERRLFYVGVTRAMRGLYLTWTSYRTTYGNMMGNTPSRFLADIPADLLSYGATGLSSYRAPAAVPRRSADGEPRYAPPPSRDLPTPASARDDGAAAAAARRGAGAPQFQAGDAVRHAIFGDGVVVSSQVSGDDEVVTVAFEGQGVKKLSLAFAPLERR